MITLGRRGDMHARRQAVAFLRSKDVVHKLFDEVGPRYAERPGGYSRIVRLGPRPGDSAEMVYLELVDTPLVFKSRMPEEGAEAEAAAAPVEPEAAEADETRGAEEPEAEAEGEEPEAEAETAAPEAEASTEEAEAPADEAEPAPEAEEGEGEDAPPAKS